jgi:hypothetical protein
MSEIIAGHEAIKGTCLDCKEFSNCGTVYQIKKDNLRTKNLAYEYFKTNKDYCPDYAFNGCPKA